MNSREKYDPLQVQAVEALDSWQMRVLGARGPMSWEEDTVVKGASIIHRGLLAIIHKGDKTWLYLWVSPQFLWFICSFRKPLTRSRVDRWLTYKIVSNHTTFMKGYNTFLKGYNTDYLSRCRKLLASHPEGVMPLMTPREGGFPNLLGLYLAKEYLDAT